MYKLVENLTRDWVEDIAKKTGYPLLQVEFLAHMMHAANELSRECLVLKGTAVQQHRMLIIFSIFGWNLLNIISKT